MSSAAELRPATDTHDLPDLSLQADGVWARLRSAALARRQLTRRALPAAVTWAFFLTFGGQGIRDLVGWYGYAVLAALCVAGLVLLAGIAGPMGPRRALPWTVVSYTALCATSLLWSAYRPASTVAVAAMVATTTGGVVAARSLGLRAMLDALTRALRAILCLSMALEFYVAAVLRHRIPPVYMRGWEHVPDSYYWVNGMLFDGGPIQGFVGNRNPLAFIALLALLCTLVRLLGRNESVVGTVSWSMLSVLVLVLTRSATVLVAALASLGLLVVLLCLRRVPPDRRRRVIAVLVGVVGAVILVLFSQHDAVAGLLGRSSDMSGRMVIWDRVLDLSSERPLLGYGWILVWVPSIPMFSTLVIRPDGTPTMQAHNAYLDALLQTGVVGMAIIVALVVSVVLGAYRVALRSLDRQTITIAPALLVTALAVQSLTESHLLFEGNWMLVVAIATWLGVRADAEPRHRLRRVAARFSGARGADDPWAGQSAGTAPQLTRYPTWMR